jgi:Gnt-I system high-affinity gluconate transporter
MPLIIILFGIIALLLLIIRFKLNAFIALIMVAIGVGLAVGMPFDAVMLSVRKGVGGTLGYLALVIGFGAMLGGLIAESGAAHQITDRLIDLFGEKYIQWALMLTGFIVGIPIFYTVGFVMLVPLVFAVGKTTRLPLLYLAIPMVAALSVTHGFLPPHPAPTTLAVDFYHADINKTLLYGLILAIPTVIIAGPIFARTLKNIKTDVPENLFQQKEIPVSERPSFGVSMLTALSPVILMAAAAIVKLTMAADTSIYKFFSFVGEPVMALLLSLLFGILALGVFRGQKMSDVSITLTTAVKGVAMIMLIIGGGGAFKQVLIDSGTGEYLREMMSGTDISPIILAWSIAAVLRISLGSATVAAMTAAGIVAPIVAGADVSPELLVLATGAGSLTFSQVNDTGFWLFKEYFNLSIADTFRSWTAMETLVSFLGLSGCLLLSYIV